VEGDDGKPILRPGGKRRRECLSGEQRHVAIGHHHFALEILQRRARRRRGMAGAQLLVLHHAVGAQAGGIGAHLVGAGGSHHHDAADTGSFEASNDMTQDRQARHLV